MLSRSRACAMTLLALLVSFAWAMHAAKAQQAGSSPQLDSPVGVWGCAGDVDKKTDYIVLLNVTATKLPGVFQVEGAVLSRLSRIPAIQIKGTLKYKDAKNEFLGTYSPTKGGNPLEIPIDGSVSQRADGAGGSQLVFTLLPHPTYVTYELLRDPDTAPQVQAAAPIPVQAEARRELEITALTVEPAEIESGKEVTIEYKFLARNIPDSSMQLTDTASVSGPGMGKVESKLSLSGTQPRSDKSGNMDGIGAGKHRIAPTPPGRYTCQIELKADGYPTAVTREVSFTVKPRQAGQATGAGPGKPGNSAPAVYVLDQVIDNPGKKPASEKNGAETMTTSLASGSCSHTYTKEGQNLNATFSVTFGTPPRTIAVGDSFVLDIKGSASGQEVPDWIGGRFESSGLEITVDKPGTSRGKDVYGKGIYLGGYGGPKYLTSDEGSYRFTLKSAPWNDKIEIDQVASGCGTAAAYIYKRKLDATPSPTADTQTKPPSDGVTISPVDAAASAPHAMGIRLQSPTLVLVPGEEGWPNDVLVSGWKPEGGRVEIDIPVQDGWGSLQVTRDLVVSPGPTSKPTFSMTGPEDSFQEIWSARSSAKAGVYYVPITVRQAGVGEAMTTLTVLVVPKGFSGYGTNPAALEPWPVSTTPSGITPGGRPQATPSAGTLSAHMQSPTLILVPGEEGWPNNALVSGWKPDGDRVAIDVPVQDNWGSLQVTRDIVVFPGSTSKPTSSMTGPEDSFQQVWSARVGAKPGTYQVPITIRQPGVGETTTVLTIAIIAKGASGYGPAVAPDMTSAAPGAGTRAQPATMAPAEAELQVAQILLQQQRPEDALRLLDTYIADHPSSKPARALRGYARMWHNDLPAARADFAWLAKQDPSDWDSRRHLADLLLAAGERETALQEAAALVQAHPENELVLLTHAYICLMNAERETARRQFARVAGMDPALARSLYAQAVQWRRAEVLPLALEAYSCALWLNPNDVRPYFGLGMVYGKMNQRDLAIRAFERFVRSDPASDFTEEARAELQRLKTAR